MPKNTIKVLGASLLTVISIHTYGALPTGYQFDITTHYTFTDPNANPPGTPPSDLAVGDLGAPDTGYLTVLNSGTTTFTGHLSLSGVTPGAAEVFLVGLDTVLAPGAHLSLSLNNESSNHGGYGENGANPQFGAQFSMNGTISDGTDSEAVLLQVFDSDIHSGVTRNTHASPSGLSSPPDVFSDSYVLQGGDPFGGDTGDDFEVTQADGHYQFFEAAGNGVPDVGGTAQLLFAGAAAVTWLRRQMR